MASVESVGHMKSPAMRHLAAYWFAKRGKRPMPAIADIDPIEIPSVLSHIWLCDYQPDSGRFRYRLAGDEINDFWGFNLRDKHLDEFVPAERLPTSTERLHMARELPAVVCNRICLSLTEEITRDGERIILPLSDDGKTVTSLLGATQRNWFRDLEFDPYVTSSETTTVTSI